MEDVDLVSIAVEEFEDDLNSDGETVDETLEQAVRNIRDQTYFGNARAELSTNPSSGEHGTQPHRSNATPSFKITQNPEVADDFIRNFLYGHNLSKSLSVFQNEWYELMHSGKLSQEAIIPVSDIYQMNAELSRTIDRLRSDVNDYKDIAAKAQATWDRLRKQRDFHRMHHKRVVQEKNKLLVELKSNQKQLQAIEPSLRQLQAKYEAAMKDATMQRIEKEKAQAQVRELELKLSLGVSHVGEPSKPVDGTQQKPPRERKAASFSKKNTTQATYSAERIASPYLRNPGELARANVLGFKTHQSFKAHDLAVSALKFHPTKKLLATVSDDKTWKLWHFPSCELVMTGEGHSDWLSDCDFHPDGQLFATASADRSVKVWDFAQGSSTATLAEHQNVVWSVAFDQTSGSDSLATASMDQTCKIWDLQKAKVTATLRGHADAVNQVIWRPYSSTVVTCSGDKTVSLWDTRSGHCAITLYGHLNAVNSVATNLTSDVLASCDSDGMVKFWDWRNVRELKSLSTGPYPANKLCFDPAGTALAVASDDKTTKVYTLLYNGELPDPQVTTTSEVLPRDVSPQDILQFNESLDAVQAVAFDSRASNLVSCSSDSMVHIYS